MLKLDRKIKNYYGDVRNKKTIESKIKKFRPDILFHLAAQPLVKESYNNPEFTISTNVLGTLNVLEIIRKVNSIKSAIIITEAVEKGFFYLEKTSADQRKKFIKPTISFVKEFDDYIKTLSNLVL